jgi:hypothetical protein
VIVSLPAVRLDPFTVRLALEAAPDTIAAAEPSDTPPAVNVTLPVGGFAPVTAVIFAVNCVVALCTMLAGLAVSVMVVPMVTGRLAHFVTRL